jgi:hypothetical protein
MYLLKIEPRSASRGQAQNSGRKQAVNLQPEIFTVTSGTAQGLLGEMTGTYSIDTITTTIIPGIAILRQASVTGTGTFVIHDGAYTLSGMLSWVNLMQLGTGSALNTTGLVNLTGVTYNGHNTDLVNLRNAASGSNTLDFTFNPAVSLTQLRNGGQHNNQFLRHGHSHKRS